VAANGRRGRPQGQRHRDIPPSSGEVRVKRCGKSAPRPRQRVRPGKPRREQDRIGMARARQRAQACFQAAVRVGCKRRCASSVPDEWPPRRGNPALQNPAYRPTGSFPVARERQGVFGGRPSQWPGRGAVSRLVIHPQCQLRVAMRSCASPASRRSSSLSPSGSVTSCPARSSSITTAPSAIQPPDSAEASAASPSPLP
jgi:hypothetical protein